MCVSLYQLPNSTAFANLRDRKNRNSRHGGDGTRERSNCSALQIALADELCARG
jgi:hypothetical protein